MLSVIGVCQAEKYCHGGIIVTFKYKSYDRALQSHRKKHQVPCVVTTVPSVIWQGQE